MEEFAQSDCPYCGEPVEVPADSSGGSHQSFVHDCPVCCQPCEVSLLQESDGTWSVTMRTSDE